MKFVPRKPREGINVSDVHPLAEAGTLILGLTMFFVAVALLLVFLVEFVLLFVSPGAEAELFSGWTPDDLAEVSAEDIRVVELRKLLTRMANHWPDSPYEFRVELSESDDANAVAFPGGLIVVTSGLLDNVESENEIAFVLGHELGHFRHRDHMRSLGRGLVLGVLFGAVLGNESGGGLGIQIADLTVRGFSREQESDADRFGLEIVFAEFGHVGESWRFFERMEEQGGHTIALASYLSTHPIASDRIEQVKDHAEREGWPMSGPVSDLKW